MEKQSESSVHPLVANYISALTALVVAIGEAKAREAAATGNLSLLYLPTTKPVGINIHTIPDTPGPVTSLAIIRESNPRFISGNQFWIDNYIPMANLDRSIESFKQEHEEKLAKRTEAEREHQHREAMRRKEEDTKILYRLALQYPDVVKEIANGKPGPETDRES